MSAPAAFQAVFSNWRLVQGRKVVQIVLEVPIEAADAAYHVLGGMPDPSKSVWCGVARLNLTDEEASILNGGAEVPSPTGGEAATPAGDGLPARPKLRKPVAPEKRLAQQAGMLCTDPVFIAFINQEIRVSGIGKGYFVHGDNVAQWVRQICEVGSRSEIIHGTPAGDRWEKLYSKFIAWRDVPELAAS